MSQLICDDCGKLTDAPDALIVGFKCIHVRCLEWQWFGPDGLFVSFRDLLTDLDAFVSALPSWVATHLTWSAEELYKFSQLLVHHPDLEYPVETLIWAWLLEVHHLVSTHQVNSEYNVPFQLYNRCVWEVLLDVEKAIKQPGDIFDTLQQQMSDVSEGVVMNHVVFYVQSVWATIHHAFDQLQTQCPHWNNVVEFGRGETIRYLIQVCIMAIHDDLLSTRDWQNRDYIDMTDSIVSRVVEWTTLLASVPTSSIHMMHAFHEAYWRRMMSRWIPWFDNYLHVHTSSLNLFRGFIHRLNEFVSEWKHADDEKKQDLKKQVEGYFLHVKKPEEVFEPDS